MIEAVLFDLDDTLFEQRHWLSGAWRAVALAGADQGLDPESFQRALVAVAAEGSDRGRIIDRALAAMAAEHIDVAPLVQAFHGHRPARLPPWPGVIRALRRLRRRVPIAVVTDGDPDGQRAKLRALGLSRSFDAVVLSDELGRAHRKPDPAPFRAALDQLGVTEPARAVFIGDRPDKDVAGAQAVGMRAVRVRTGEYRERPDHPAPWAVAGDVVQAVAALEPSLGRRFSASAAVGPPTPLTADPAPLQAPRR